MEVCLGPYFYAIPQELQEPQEPYIITTLKLARKLTEPSETTSDIKTIGPELKKNEDGIPCTYRTAVVTRSTFKNLYQRPSIKLILERTQNTADIANFERTQDTQNTADIVNEELKKLIDTHKRGGQKPVFDPTGYQHLYQIYVEIPQETDSSVSQLVASVFVKFDEVKNKVFAIITPIQTNEGKLTEHWNTTFKYTAGAAALLQAVFDIKNEKCTNEQSPSLSTKLEAITLKALLDGEAVIVYYMTKPDPNGQKNIFACSISLPTNNQYVMQQ